MVAITIRDVPDAARDELAARAARSGQSLQEYLRAHLVAVSARPDPSEVIRRARRRVESTGTALSTQEIIEHRDIDRR
ncbi:FitA-like ribbon-helix-helix domain-containing protein [Salsipaludibacter albus]|uniref:FitA-like ribbon-helix-helix domain-containing protein n=1 Tax=Salsipaludibacter albus TaxID=2849650 RepID=UPI001EE3E4E9|nr:hypothetical protein [Salsipaludibacter albus]MBY5162074.1 hypothetical protein [Salsipaludibacter albus]